MGKIMMKKYRNLILAYGFDGIDIDKVFLYQKLFEIC